jgi:hypothetical protein
VIHYQRASLSLSTPLHLGSGMATPTITWVDLAESRVRATGRVIIAVLATVACFKVLSIVAETGQFGLNPNSTTVSSLKPAELETATVVFACVNAVVTIALAAILAFWAKQHTLTVAHVRESAKTFIVVQGLQLSIAITQFICDIILFVNCRCIEGYIMLIFASTNFVADIIIFLYFFKFFRTDLDAVEIAEFDAGARAFLNNVLAREGNLSVQ